MPVWSKISSIFVPGGKDADALSGKGVEKEMSEYDNVFSEKDLNKRSKDNAQSVTVKFYNLITDFYEYGQGQCFHFAPRYSGETFTASIARHEHFLANKLGLKNGDKVLDVGCGIMGPAREIARFSGANITGLNLNKYQVKRCETLNKNTCLTHLLNVKQGDFMNIPFPDNHFDKIYAIEALCHSPDRLKVYKEIFNKVRPGGKIFFYEWCLTDSFDPCNRVHQRIKKMIEYGNSICSLGTQSDVERDLKLAGFINEDTCNLARYALQKGNDIPWYSTLEGGCSVSNLQHSKLGRFFTHTSLSVMEFVKIAPKGTVNAHNILREAAEGLVLGGKLDIFTPMYMVYAEKPNDPGIENWKLH